MIDLVLYEAPSLKVFIVFLYIVMMLDQYLNGETLCQLALVFFISGCMKQQFTNEINR